ncbi:MAG: DUF2935 domain-containing protein [Oscillospiraceae bacterium]|nr:DUF2935 domain-containing protein [Oscillospiraceae bacterium]
MDKTYVIDSLELHLFFARIMKEHSFFLKVGFLPPNADFARKAEHFLRQFEAILSRAISLSDRVVGSCVLESGELVTEFTDCAERQTQRLTGTLLDRRLTARELRLRSRDCDERLCVSNALVRQVRQLNREALRLVEQLICFKEEILHRVETCCMATGNYPLLIEHILREARLYCGHIRRLEGMDVTGCRELQEGELFWNRIMMEHALFIRGLLDPTEEQLISTANDFAASYRQLLAAASAANNRMLRSTNALPLTRQFRDFKQAGTEGLEQCKIKGLILPLLADHVLREANHYIRLLEGRG